MSGDLLPVSDSVGLPANYSDPISQPWPVKTSPELRSVTEFQLEYNLNVETSMFSPFSCLLSLFHLLSA